LRWTRQRRARAWSQGGYSRERSDGATDERRLNASVETSSGSMRAGWSYGARKLRTAKACGSGTRCWCQADGDRRARPGLRL